MISSGQGSGVRCDHGDKLKSEQNVIMMSHRLGSTWGALRRSSPCISDVPQKKWDLVSPQSELQWDVAYLELDVHLEGHAVFGSLLVFSFQISWFAQDFRCDLSDSLTLQHIEKDEECHDTIWAELFNVTPHWLMSFSREMFCVLNFGLWDLISLRDRWIWGRVSSNFSFKYRTIGKKPMINGLVIIKFSVSNYWLPSRPAAACMFTV